MKPIDVISLIFILIGVILIIVSMVHRHKGMWNLRNDDISNSRGGIREPYDETVAGAGFILVGALCGVWDIFGAWTAALVLVIIFAANLVFNIIMARRVDQDESARYSAGIITSIFALLVGVFMLILL